MKELIVEGALGILSPTQKQEFERARETDRTLSDELADAEASLAAVALALSPLPPPDKLRLRVARSIAGAARFLPFVSRVSQLADLPASEAERILGELDDPKVWREVIPGLKLISLEGGPKVREADVSLVRVRPSFLFPQHRHLGTESVLVLQGGFEDSFDGSRVTAGTQVVRAQDSVHGYKALPGEPCIFLTVMWTGIEMLPTDTSANAKLPPSYSSLRALGS